LFLRKHAIEARKGGFYLARSAPQFLSISNSVCVLACPLDNLVRRHWARDPEALHMIASELRKKRVLSNAFYALRQSFKAKAVGHAQNRGEHAVLLFITVNAGDKAAVDFQAVHFETP